MKSLISRFVKDESGATAIEYGLIAAGLSVVIIALFGSGTDSVIQSTLTAIFDKVKDNATGASADAGTGG
ncbi:Flp family type IVb pilin [Microvirga sp. BT689]|uniref:Flp family type IVb pilin n=1 Tax=Microvirga arvi TaxID=2778731 RepID=UPI0019523861|nr:Flp family type IVb pilin [Microvirga arvi]MBM6583664.1 Flp family type IVb pilin [Microvirga arvi]